MKVGDLVRIRPDDSDPRDRLAGIILQLDSYHRESHLGRITVDPIAEVLWESGPSWIDLKRIEKIKPY